MQKIPSELYRQILEYLPILCVDLVFFHQGKVLLTYRNDEPAKGKWWIQGGRVFKGETLQEALQRKAQAEVGCLIQVIRQIGIYDFRSPVGPFPLKTGVHDVAIVYLVEPAGVSEVRLNRDHSNFRWITSIEGDLDPYVQQILKDAKVWS